MIISNFADTSEIVLRKELVDLTAKYDLLKRVYKIYKNTNKQIDGLVCKIDKITIIASRCHQTVNTGNCLFYDNSHESIQILSENRSTHQYIILLSKNHNIERDYNTIIQ